MKLSKPTTFVIQDIRYKNLTKLFISFTKPDRTRGFYECSAERFEAALQTVEPVRRAMLLDRFGARNPQAWPKTFPAIAAEYGVTRQRVHQLVSEGCHRLLVALSAKTPSNGATR